MRYFNTEGLCKPNEHYMVSLNDRMEKLKRMYVDRGKYFVINRGRQYGKTTTLRALAEYLKDDYAVISMDFQRMSTVDFTDEQAFVVSFIEYFEGLISSNKETVKLFNAEAVQDLIDIKTQRKASMKDMFRCFSRLCGTSEKLVVLIIDEADSASNNQVFIDFLAQLRAYYLDREKCPTFHSVILAGVYDIKNLKLKIRTDSERQYNSPWNIAADFKIDMSFSAVQITGMLEEYEQDHNTGMDTDKVAEEIYQYTSGYPYLVSAICKYLDEDLPEEEGFENPACAWTSEGIAQAVKSLLNANSNPLFGSMAKQLDIYSDLRDMIKDILYQGKQISFSPLVKSMSLGIMFGFIKTENGHIAVANRIFEMALLNMFIAEESISSEPFQYGQRDRSRFIKKGRLDMDLVLEKFVEYFEDIYGDNDERFIEAYGRKFFMLYLKPIINGTGNYYMEAQTRDARRTDLVVDYAGEQFVVEMKIWHGNEYNERGEEQLAEYLDYFHLDKGYMLSFNFNKNKQIGIRTVDVAGKTIVEAVV